MVSIPVPQVAWSLDGTTAATHGGVRARLHGECSWSSGPSNSTRALSLSGTCFASMGHRPSLLVGTGSMTVCAQLRCATPGALLLSKLAYAEGTNGPLGRSSSRIGYALEIGDERGLGVNLADASGLSVHEELGRVSIADGRWHHVCMVLDRSPPSHIAVYIDGRLSERLMLDRSRRLRLLGSLDSTCPLLIGRRSWDELGTRLNGSVRELALWSRALLPEHTRALSRSGLPPPNTGAATLRWPAPGRAISRRAPQQAVGLSRMAVLATLAVTASLAGGRTYICQARRRMKGI